MFEVLLWYLMELWRSELPGFTPLERELRARTFALRLVLVLWSSS